MESTIARTLALAESRLSKVQTTSRPPYQVNSIAFPGALALTHARNGCSTRLVFVGDVLGFGRRDEQGHLERAWKALISEEDLVCPRAGMRYAAIPKFNFLILGVNVRIALSLS